MRVYVAEQVYVSNGFVGGAGFFVALSVVVDEFVSNAVILTIEFCEDGLVYVVVAIEFFEV